MPSRDEQGGLSSQSDVDAEIRKEAIAWVVRLRNSSLTSDDRRAFENWEAKSPVHARIFQSLSAVWDDPDLHQAAIEIAHQMPRRPGPGQATFRGWALRVAAIAACAILLAMAAGHFDLITRFQADYMTVAGERRTVQLFDRSTVTLNTQTAIATSFDGTTRRVRLLKGEAYFRVEPDSTRPFVVESQETATRAVGTQFVVRTQPGHDQVTVLEGIVEIETRQVDHSHMQVTAGLQIQAEGGRLGHPYSVDIATASAWLRGRLVVNGVSFAQVIDELRRYYPGTIVLWNHAIGEMQVTGTYDLEDPSKALSLLTQTVPVRMVGMADRLAILF